MKTLQIAFASMALLLGASSAWAQGSDDELPIPDEGGDDPLGDPGMPDETDPMVGEDPAAIASEDGVSGSGQKKALGVSLGYSPAGTSAIFIDKALTDKLVLHAGPTFQYLSVDAGPSGMEVNATFTEFGLAAYGIFGWKEFGPVALNLIGGAEFGWNKFEVDMVGDASGVDIRFAAGIKIDYFVLERISIWMNSGLTIGILGDASTARLAGTGVAIGSDVSSIQVQLANNLKSMFGMTWWM